MVKTTHTKRWHHLPAYSRCEQGIAPGGGGVLCWRGLGTVNMPRWMQISTLDGYLAVCLVLTIEVYGTMLRFVHYIGSKVTMVHI